MGVSAASEDAELTEVVGLLDDDVARAILRETSREPLSASDLADRVEGSLPTIYRRLEALSDADLLFTQTQIDPDGDHFKQYSARFETLLVELERGTFEAELTLKEDPADRFTRLFEELG